MSFLYWLFLPLPYRCVKRIMALSWTHSHSHQTVFVLLCSRLCTEQILNSLTTRCVWGIHSSSGHVRNLKINRGKDFQQPPVSGFWAGSEGQWGFMLPRGSAMQAPVSAGQDWAGNADLAWDRWSGTEGPARNLPYSKLEPVALRGNASPVLDHQIFRRGQNLLFM